MNDDVKALYLIAFLMLLVLGMLAYVGWRHSGEIELLHERVDAVDMRPVARILRATDDETAEAVAKGEQ